MILIELFQQNNIIIRKNMNIFDFLGSGVGFLVLIIVGTILLFALKNKLSEENQNSCLEKIFIWAFIIAGICTWLAMCIDSIKD